MKNARGFTLVELMTTMVLMAVVLVVGIPSFQRIFESNSTTTQANEVIAAMNLARSEAIRRGANVTVQAPAGGFQDGWCIHVGAGCGAPGELRTYPAMRRVTVDSAGVVLVTFNGSGAKVQPPIGTDVNILISPQTCQAGSVDRARAININNTGRLSVAKANCP
jgi:type IV fimbrial biogenesis protein FimT